MPPIPLHRFRPRLVDALAGYRRADFFADLAAGITVGVVALPLAMAFAIASGASPEQGLVTAIVGGLLISALGGSNVQIGGPAGAFIVVVYGIVERHGMVNLLLATLMAGALLILMGWLRLGVLVRYIPVSIVIGFTNGIAVLIALSQLKDLLGLSVARLPADFFSQLGALMQHLPTANPWALGLGLLSLAVVALWPRATAAGGPWRRRLSHLPGTLVALVLATLAAHALTLPVETIGSRFGTIAQTLSWPRLPDFDWATAQQLVIPAVTLALLGAVESLLCARIGDNLHPGPRHDPNQELMAQGVANLVAPLFGGLPATGTIARTVTNVRAGAVSPVAGIVHALTLLAVMLVAAPLALHVPLAALAGILLFVAWNMGEWREFARLRHFLLPYRTVLLATFSLTVVVDLTVAVEVGLLTACGFFIYRMGSLFRITALPTEEAGSVQAFELYGALFFGAVGKVEDLPQSLAANVRTVVLDMHRLISLDTSGLDALIHMHEQLQQRGIRLVLRDVNEQPLDLIRRGGLAFRLGPEGLVSSHG